jgi:hypothetical protein
MMPNAGSDLLPDISKAAESCTAGQQADMFSYSGPIHSLEVTQFITYALGRKRHESLSLLLTTYGGDAHAAYRMARSLQSFWKEIRVFVVGPCKSAGTLVALGAQEIVFGPFGELGPLDIQVTKKDDLMSVGSGLDSFQALAILQNQAYLAFEEYLLSILQGSQGAISTTTACEVASQLVSGLFSPIAAQIDPQKMGEMQRMIMIAKAYGERLGRDNLQQNTLDRLVRDYPSHSFIIDYKEAGSLFHNVRMVRPPEMAVVSALQQRGSCVLTPSDVIIMDDVSQICAADQEGHHGDYGNDAEAQRSDRHLGSHDAGEPRSPHSPESAPEGLRKRLATAGRRRRDERPRVGPM